MYELIKIKQHNGKRAVSARELYGFLEVSRDFTNWCKQMFEYGFEEEKDFTPILAKSTGGRPSVDYALTLDCAKEIAMIQRNDKGKMAREYFIECEQALINQKKTLDFTDPSTVLQLAQNWADEYNKRIEAEKKIKQLQPRADFVDRILASDDLIDIGQAAKVLSLPFGRNTFFKELRERGILFQGRNEPMQVYIERGYFKLSELEIKRENRKSIMVLKVLVTQKGLAFLSKQFPGNQSNKLALIK